MNKNEIPSYYQNFMKHYNPTTVIGTTEFMIRTSLGEFRKRGETVVHCIKDLYETENRDFRVFGWGLVQNSNKK